MTGVYLSDAVFIAVRIVWKKMFRTQGITVGARNIQAIRTNSHTFVFFPLKFLANYTPYTVILSLLIWNRVTIAEQACCLWQIQTSSGILNAGTNATDVQTAVSA